MKRLIIVIFINILLPIVSFAGPIASFAGQKKALIFGVTGQDGSYLSEFLLKKGYEVHGVKRRSSLSNTKRIDYLLEDSRYKGRFFLYYSDLTDGNSINTLIGNIYPDEVYNLAAQSHVKVSFEMPEYTAEVDALGVLRILEAIKKYDKDGKIKFYQASSSEMFGKVQEVPQKETTLFYPRSPYAVAKVYGFWITRNYREAYNIYACNGILFNHESPKRGPFFVTRKISLAVANVAMGIENTLYLGNLDAQRDWGYAKDYAEAMWVMLQQEKPDDYVIATGETHSVREFVELAFKEIGINIGWQGEGINEEGFDKATGAVLVKIDPQYFRPTEVDLLIGDSTKACNVFQWKPSISFQELVQIMVREDIKMMQKKLNK